MASFANSKQKNNPAADTSSSNNAMMACPIVVGVALRPCETNVEQQQSPSIMDEPCLSVFLSSVNRTTSEVAASHQQGQSVAEFVRYIVEQACPECFLLDICQRAMRQGNNKFTSTTSTTRVDDNEDGNENDAVAIISLMYGNGYETKVYLNTSSSSDTLPTTANRSDTTSNNSNNNNNNNTLPLYKIAIGASVYAKDATPTQVGNVWICASDEMWTHVWCGQERFANATSDGNNNNAHSSYAAAGGGGGVCVYIQTRTDFPYLLPPMPKEELARRSRSIRIWTAAPNDQNVLVRMEEFQEEKAPPAAPPVAAAPATTTTADTATTATTTAAAAVVRPNDSESAGSNDKKTKNKTKKKRSKSSGTSAAADSTMDTEHDDDEAAAAASSAPAKKKAKKSAATTTGNGTTAKPKKPLTLYNLYSKQQRPILKERHPGISVTELNTLISNAYKDLTDEQKEEYAPLLMSEKERYDKEVKAWNESNPQMQLTSAASDKKEENDDDNSKVDATAMSKKRVKDPSKPKRAKTAYNFFLAEQRPIIQQQNPNADFVEMSRLVATAWAALSVDKKQKYVDLSSDDKAAQKVRMDEWEAGSRADSNGQLEKGNGNDDTESEQSDNDSKKVKAPTKKKKDPTKPKKGKSAYNFFMKEQRSIITEQHPDADRGEISHLVGDAYKALSAQDKQKYVDMADQDKATQSKMLEEWQANQDMDHSHDDGDSKKSAKAPAKKKAKKDPTKPKYPTSAYLYFSSAARKSIAEKNPGAASREIVKLTGAAFSELSEQEKAPFVARAKKDKERYDREMKEWKAKQKQPVANETKEQTGAPHPDDDAADSEHKDGNGDDGEKPTAKSKTTDASEGTTAELDSSKKAKAVPGAVESSNKSATGRTATDAAKSDSADANEVDASTNKSALAASTFEGKENRASPAAAATPNNAAKRKHSDTANDDPEAADTGSTPAAADQVEKGEKKSAKKKSRDSSKKDKKKRRKSESKDKKKHRKSDV